MLSVRVRAPFKFIMTKRFVTLKSGSKNLSPI
jgi:hypothetical protein